MTPVRQFVAVRRQFVNEVMCVQFVSSLVRSIGRTTNTNTHDEHHALKNAAQFVSDDA